MAEPFLPFFISRDQGIADPGAAAMPEASRGSRLAGDAARLERWLDSRALPIRTMDGPAAVRAVGIGERGFR